CSRRRLHLRSFPTRRSSDLTSIVGAQRFWQDANILLVGTGAYAGTTLNQLQARGAKNVAVHSSSGRAQQFVDDRGGWAMALGERSEEHTSELQSRFDLVCRL